MRNQSISETILPIRSSLPTELNTRLEQSADEISALATLITLTPERPDALTH